MKDHFPLDLSTEEVDYDFVKWIVQQKEIDMTQSNDRVLSFTWTTLRIFDNVVEARNYLRLCRLSAVTQCRIVKVYITASVPIALVD